MTRARSLLTAGLLALALTTPALPAAAAAPSHGPTSGVVARKHKPHVQFLNTTYYAGLGNQIVAEGRVPGGKRAVRLQVKLPGGWRTFAGSKSNHKGKFVVSGPLEWYGTHTVRLYAPGRNPFARRALVHALLVYAPRGSAKDYKFFKYHGLHYTLNPCQTVRYRVGYAEVGPAGLALVQEAMAQISWATGIHTKYVGTTNAIPFRHRHTRVPRGTDLVIRFATEAELPEFASRDKAGFGGPLRSTYGRTAHGKKVWKIQNSGVTFNTNAYFNNFVYGFIGTHPTFGEVAIHELGHAFGLNHVTHSPDEIMNGRVYTPYPDGYYRGIYAAGDLAGLAKLGLGQGCVQQSRPFRARTTARTAPPLPVSQPMS